jgi:hypothetical protein
MTLWAPNAREASLKPAAGQKLFHGMNHDGAQRSRVGLEVFLIALNISRRGVLRICNAVRCIIAANPATVTRQDLA